jgi:hypothetical protein
MPIARLRKSWLGLGASLGIFALVVQALLPNIVAAEIDLADGAGGGVFDNCLFAPRDADHDADAPRDSRHHHHNGDCGLCPICLALLASTAFAAPATISVPVPSSPALYAFAPQEFAAPDLPSLTSYRSRAPPSIG